MTNTCQCECCKASLVLGKRAHSICLGTSGLSVEKEAAYRRIWLKMPPTMPAEAYPEPVGDMLAEIFEWLGAVKSGTCGCAKLQSRMNRWGVKGCRANIDLILSKLEKAAFERNLPIPRLAFVIPLEFAMWRAKRHGERVASQVK